MTKDAEHIRHLVGQVIVVDVEAPFVYVGTLRDANSAFLVLNDADVHDLRDSDTTREVYVLSSARDGVRRNRIQVQLRWDSILSVSRLSDVVDH